MVYVCQGGSTLILVNFHPTRKNRGNLVMGTSNGIVLMTSAGSPRKTNDTLVNVSFLVPLIGGLGSI